MTSWHLHRADIHLFCEKLLGNQEFDSFCLIVWLSEYLKTAFFAFFQLVAESLSFQGHLLVTKPPTAPTPSAPATVKFRQRAEAFVFVSDSNSAIQIAEMLNQVGKKWLNSCFWFPRDRWDRWYISSPNGRNNTTFCTTYILRRSYHLSREPETAIEMIRCTCLPKGETCQKLFMFWKKGKG